MQHLFLESYKIFRNNFTNYQGEGVLPITLKEENLAELRVFSKNRQIKFPLKLIFLYEPPIT